MSERHAEDVRALLVTANHILSREGVLDAFGHVSVRHPDAPDRYLLSRSLSPALVGIQDLMTFDMEGRPVDGDTRTPYLERFIHGAIYEARPDVNAVIHHHAHALLPFGLTRTPLRPAIHVAGAMGREAPVWDIRDRFAGQGLLVTNMDQARDLARCLGRNAAVLMRGHGAVVTGVSIRDAVLLAIYINVNAGILLQAHQHGEVTYLDESEIDRSADALLSPTAAQRAWDYFVSRLP